MDRRTGALTAEPRTPEPPGPPARERLWSDAPALQVLLDTAAEILTGFRRREGRPVIGDPLKEVPVVSDTTSETGHQ